MVKHLPAKAGDTTDEGSIPGSGRSPGGGDRSPLQCSCLENPTDRGAWWATVHGVTKSRTRLKRLSTCAWVAPVLGLLNKRFWLKRRWKLTIKMSFLKIICGVIH